MQAPPRRMRSLVKLILITVVGLGVVAFLLAWSGIYNVAASSGHWSIVEAVLRSGLRNSISLRARGIDEPDLNSKDLITLGAGHFERGCTFCHGSPDRPGSRVAAAMLPSPPDLSTARYAWTNQELFRIIRHGIKYTGMPAWPALERKDEVWALVAFLRKLPDMDAEQYRALALPRGRELEPQQEPGARPAAEAVSRCANCHGDRDGGPESALVPRLHGQRQAFLANALHQYANRTRPSGIMQAVAAELDAREIDLLARYYAELPPIPAVPPSSGDAPSTLGRRLATDGDPARRVPACVSCHRRTAHHTFPLLDGQSADYLAGQLRLWKSGHNASTSGGVVMAPIAQRLSEHDIDALARYFAGNVTQQAAESRP